MRRGKLWIVVPVLVALAASGCKCRKDLEDCQAALAQCKEESESKTKMFPPPKPTIIITPTANSSGNYFTFDGVPAESYAETGPFLNECVFGSIDRVFVSLPSGNATSDYVVKKIMATFGSNTDLVIDASQSGALIWSVGGVTMSPKQYDKPSIWRTELCQPLKSKSLKVVYVDAQGNEQTTDAPVAVTLRLKGTC